jgi:hypothetical protein
MRRDRDHGLRDPLAQELGGVLGKLAQHEGRDLLGRVHLAVDVEANSAVRARRDVERDRGQFALHLVEPSANEPFRGVDRALRVEDRLAAGHQADDALAGVGKRDD